VYIFLECGHQTLDGRDILSTQYTGQAYTLFFIASLLFLPFFYDLKSTNPLRHWTGVVL
jgi:hypothetical protein